MVPRSHRREQWLLVVVLVAGTTCGATCGWITHQQVAFLVSLVGGAAAIRRTVTLLADPTDDEPAWSGDPYRTHRSGRAAKDALERLLLGALLFLVGILGIVCAARSLWSFEVAVEGLLVAVGVRWVETSIQDARRGA